MVSSKWAKFVDSWGIYPCNRVVWLKINFNSTYFNIISLYASNDHKERISLWKWLAELEDIPWIIRGDFNMIENLQD